MSKFPFFTCFANVSKQGLEASTSRPASKAWRAASKSSPAVLWNDFNIATTPQSEYTYPRKPNLFRRISVNMKCEAELGTRFQAL